jgi:hypothetical protein
MSKLVTAPGCAATTSVLWVTKHPGCRWGQTADRGLCAMFLFKVRVKYPFPIMCIDHSVEYYKNSLMIFIKEKQKFIILWAH